MAAATTEECVLISPADLLDQIGLKKNAKAPYIQCAEFNTLANGVLDRSCE